MRETKKFIKLIFTCITLFISILFLQNQESKAAIVEQDGFKFDIDYFHKTAILSKYTGTNTNIDIPSTIDGCTVTEIGKRAFNKDGLGFPGMDIENVKIPETVTVIGDSAFHNCELLKTVLLPASLEQIEENAFSNCSNLELSELPNSITFIGDFAFSNCQKITIKNLPDSLTELGGKSTFSECTSITEITFPDSLTITGSGSFWDCTSLRKITFSGSISEIPGATFSGCSSLENVIIPSTIKTIGKNAFGNCNNLKTVVVVGNTFLDSGYDNNTLSSFPKNSTITIYGLKDSQAENYCAATGTKFNAIELPIISADKNKKSIKLSWNAVSKGNYDVYRRVNYAGTFEKISTTEKTFYVDTDITSGSSYEYYIQSTYFIDSNEMELPSQIVEFYYDDISKPSKVKIKKIKQTKEKIIITIKKLKAQSFEIQYSTNKKLQIPQYEYAYSENIKTSFELNKSLFSSKTKYYLRIRGYNMDNNGNTYYGKWSTIKSFKTK